MIREYLKSVRIYDFSRVKPVSSTFKGFLTTLFEKKSFHPGIIAGIQKIVYGLYKIFNDYVTIINEEDETEIFTGEKKRDVIFKEMINTFGEENTLRVFSIKPIKERARVIEQLGYVQAILNFNIDNGTKILGAFIGDTTIKMPKGVIGKLIKGGERSDADLLFELIAEIHTNPALTDDEIYSRIGNHAHVPEKMEHMMSVLQFMKDLISTDPAL